MRSAILIAIHKFLFVGCLALDAQIHVDFEPLVPLKIILEILTIKNGWAKQSVASKLIILRDAKWTIYNGHFSH